MKQQHDITIALFAGGASAERPVSKMSSKGIFTALKSLGYNVVLIDPAYGKNQPKNEEDFFGDAIYADISTKNYSEVFELKEMQNIDLVFIGLHGKWGEDGTLQSMLELRKLPYTGSGVLACAIALDKAMSKIMFKDRGVPVPDGFSLQQVDADLQSVIDRIESTFGFPVVVKPNDEGSTFGLTICHNKVSLPAALDLSFRYSKTTLIEAYIPGRELTVGIIGETALPVLEIVPKHDIYDYECKYTKGMSEYICPADIPFETSKKLQEDALHAYRSLGCKDYARVDFRMRDDYRYYCLELNPLPGMTATSLVPKAALAKGMSYEKVVDEIVRSALS